MFALDLGARFASICLDYALGVSDHFAPTISLSLLPIFSVWCFSLRVLRLGDLVLFVADDRAHTLVAPRILSHVFVIVPVLPEILSLTRDSIVKISRTQRLGYMIVLWLGGGLRTLDR